MSLKYKLKRFSNFADTPHRLGLAFGLGVFLGVIPGTGVIVAVGAATLFRLNLPLMVAGAMLTNPITTPFVYAMSYYIGLKMLGDHPGQGFLGTVVLPTLAGNLPLAASLAALGYLFVWVFLTLHRSRCSNRRKQEVS